MGVQQLFLERVRMAQSRALIFQKSLFTSMIALKNENAFYFNLKACFVLKIFKCFVYFLVMQKKRLDQKTKVNFEIYDVLVWLTKNYAYCPISHKLKATRQFGQLTECNKYFSSKIMQKMRHGDQSQTAFCFFKKPYIR